MNNTDALITVALASQSTRHVLKVTSSVECGSHPQWKLLDSLCERCRAFLGRVPAVPLGKWPPVRTG